MQYPELISDTQEVLRTLTAVEKSIPTCGGSWFTVRIMPYRTLDDRIDGVVITFADITVAKELEAELRMKRTELEKCADASSKPPTQRKRQTKG